MANHLGGHASDRGRFHLHGRAVTAVLDAVRLVQFAAAMVLLGVPCFALALAAACPAATKTRQDFELWVRPRLVVGTLAALVSALLWLDLEAGIMANGWGRMLDPGTISTVLFGTVFGRAWCWAPGISAVALVAVAVARARRRKAGLGSCRSLAALQVATLAWAGHAMQPGVSHLLIMVAHLLAGGLWVGSLPALHHLAAQARQRGASEARAALRRMLPLYSRAGYAAVAVVLVTGLINSLFLVGSLVALFTTSFGRVLLAKIALVLVMVAIAADNRFIIQPRILAVDDVRAVPLSALWRRIALEQRTGVLVLAAGRACWERCRRRSAP